jgi:hypothetical protein
MKVMQWMILSIFSIETSKLFLADTPIPKIRSILKNHEIREC